MTNDEILDKIKKILSAQLHIEPEKVLGASNIKNDLSADSLDMAEIALMIKDEFDYDMSDQDFVTVSSVNDLAGVLQARLNANGK